MKPLLILSFISGICFTSSAQVLQWASKVIQFSSELSPGQYSAQQALGKPNVLPAGGESPNAWVPDKPGKKEFLKLGFDNPLNIRQVAVAESYNPSAISRILAYDESNTEHLIYNFNPALIFMGDSGALFLGFMLAATGIKLRFPTHPLLATWFIPIVVLALPIFDTTLVFVSRLRRGLNPLTHPGTDHISHRLVARGFTRREAVLILYLVAIALGVMAMLCTQIDVAASFIVLASAALVGLLALYEFEFRKTK